MTIISKSEAETEAAGEQFAKTLTDGAVVALYGDLGARELYHFDMYRLGSSDELFDIGWEDYLSRGGICAVEWSENVEDAFEGDQVCVRIEKTGDAERLITIGEAGAC